MAVDGIDGHRRGKLEEREESMSSGRADVGRDGRAVEPNFQVRLESGKVNYTMVCFSFFIFVFFCFFVFFVFFLLSSHLFRTSDYTLRLICGAPAGVTQAEGHTGVFFPSSPPSFCSACLNFLSREGFSRPFPSSNVKSNFVHP